MEDFIKNIKDKVNVNNIKQGAFSLGKQLLRSNQAYRDYEGLLQDLVKYNRADTVNMDEAEMNKFRHIAGPAYLTSKGYNPASVYLYGLFKEGKDLLQGRGLKDTYLDLGNNFKGISTGYKHRGLDKKTLFDYIFENNIKPDRNVK